MSFHEEAVDIHYLAYPWWVGPVEKRAFCSADELCKQLATVQEVMTESKMVVGEGLGRANIREVVMTRNMI